MTFPTNEKNIAKIVEATKSRLRKHFQAPTTGKLKGRMEHTYNDKDSFKGHKLAKKFGGAGYQGERPHSKHVLNLKQKALRGKQN